MRRKDVGALPGSAGLGVYLQHLSPQPCPYTLVSWHFARACI